MLPWQVEGSLYNVQCEDGLILMYSGWSCRLTGMHGIYRRSAKLQADAVLLCIWGQSPL